MRTLLQRLLMLAGEVVVLYPLIGWISMIRLIPTRRLQKLLKILPMLLILVLPAIAAQERTEIPDHILVARALAAVRKEMAKRKLPVEEFRLEITGKPVRLPNHEKFHRSPTQQPGEEATVKGRVTDSADEPVTNVMLRLYRRSGERKGVAVPVDGYGYFQINRLPPGRYRLTARANGFKITGVEFVLDAGEQQHVQIPMEYGAENETVFYDLEASVQEDQLPHAYVHVAAYRSGLIENIFQVAFQATGHFVNSASEPDWNTIPMTFFEYQTQKESIRKFFDTGFDIERGPERFLPFLTVQAPVLYLASLSINLKCKGKGGETKLTEAENLASSAHVLDFLFLMFQSLPEGLNLQWTTNLMAELGDPNMCSFAQFQQTMRKFRLQMLSQLHDLGALNPKHSENTKPYLRAAFGAYLLSKEINEKEHVKGIPSGTTLFVTTHFSMHFGEINGELKLVAMATED